tara:strand:+ start:30457 stop:31107 length:651 start_codon:yes stop_codon:yes gene_type:complete
MEEFLLTIQDYILSAGIDSLFIQVVILAAVAAFPVGPWSIVALDQSTQHGKKHGLIIAGIATIGHTANATIAAYFFPTINVWLQEYIHIFYIVAGIFMFGFGVYFLFKKKNQHIKSLDKKSHTAIYISTALVSFAHPLTLITYIFVCFIIQSLGTDMAHISIWKDFTFPLFFATMIMWGGWIFVGSVLSRFITPIFRIFGLAFIYVGGQMLYEHLF